MHRLDSESLSQLEGDDDAGRKPWHIAQLIAPENARIPVPAGSRDEVVRAFIAQVHFPEAVPVDLVVARVLERERLCSTALTDGVALLHTPRSRPRVLAAHDLLAIGRLDAPVDFGALDGSQTETLVLLLARSERDQIALLAKVARLCREPGFLASLRGARGHDEAIDLIDRTEQRLFVHAN
jgi:mannitol/fructose-specific phosphotransferase system IIA component (Ntr-type)